MNYAGAFAAILITPLFAGGGILGVAVSQGNFEIDHSVVQGNANFQENSRIVTRAAPGRLQFNNGTRGVIGADSRVVVHAERMELEAGLAAVRSPRFRILAAEYTVTPQGAAQAIVQLDGGKVLVSSEGGEVAVSNRGGVLLARVQPGRALAFEPNGGPPGSLTASGVLRREGTKFLLKDELTSLQLELIARPGVVEFAPETGRRVRVSGSPQASLGANVQVVQVARLERLDSESGPSAAPPDAGGKAPPANEGGTGGSTTETGTATAGVSHGTKITIAVLAIGGGTAAALGLSQISR